MKEYTYRVEEIRRAINESSQEFKAVLGTNVERDNVKNNSEFYKASEKKAKDYDGGLQEPKKKGKLPPKVDGNRTTLDYNPQAEPDEDYKKRVKAQAKGYTSELEEKNGNERGGVEMDDDGRIFNQFTDAQKDREDVKKAIQKSGLASRTFPDKAFDKEHLYEGAKPKAKRLKFKHTTFITEAQVLNRIPEEYKNHGQRIYMVDASGNEYIVECTRSEKAGLVETTIVSHRNKKVMENEVNRIFEMMDYKASAKRGTINEKVGEQARFEELMNLTRSIEEQD